jgi:hypothetical protein
MADLECFFEKNGLGPLGVKSSIEIGNIKKVKTKPI